jgi:hypothetical protein
MTYFLVTNRIDCLVALSSDEHFRLKSIVMIKEKGGKSRIDGILILLIVKKELRFGICLYMFEKHLLGCV